MLSLKSTIALILVLVAFSIMFELQIAQSVAKSKMPWNVKWYLVRDGIIHKVYNISIENPDSSKARNFNISVLIDNTNFPAEEIKNINIYEWASVKRHKTVPIYKTIMVFYEYNKTRDMPPQCREVNETYYACEHTVTAGEKTVTYWSDEWVPLSGKFTKREKIKVKKNIGAKSIDRKGAIKWFRVEFDAPIVKTNNGWGQKGRIAFVEETTKEIYHPWFDSSWSYRRNITVNVGRNVDNYAIPINITNTTGMDPQGDDLRFTDINNNSLYAWKDEALSVDGQYFYVYVKGNFTTANGTQIQMYYGNAGASPDWDFVNTFYGADGTFSTSTGWNTTYQKTTLSINTTQGYLNYTGYPNSIEAYITRDLGANNNYTQGDFILDYDFNITLPEQLRQYMSTGVGDTQTYYDPDAPARPTNGFFAWQAGYNSNTLGRAQCINSGTFYTSVNTGTPTEDKWYYVRAIRTGTTWNASFYDNATARAMDWNPIATHEVTGCPSGTMQYLHAINFYDADGTPDDNNGHIDNIILRAYDSDSSYSIGAEETGGVGGDNPPTINLNAPTNGATEINTLTIVFNFTPSDDGFFANCSLWTNESSWSQKELNTSNIVSGSLNSITETFGDYGDYIWNIECYDNGSNRAFAGTNYTLHLKTDWWNTNYAKRKPIDINVSDGSTLTDWQVLLNITYDVDMQADFDDLRFTNNCSGDAYELPYWIETKFDSSYADVWVKTDINQTICMYYSNPSASTTSNGHAVFLIFDDAETGSPTDYWTVTTTNGWVSYRPENTRTGALGTKSIKQNHTSDAGSDASFYNDSQVLGNFSLTVWVRDNTSQSLGLFLVTLQDSSSSTQIQAGFYSSISSTNYYYYNGASNIDTGHPRETGYRKFNFTYNGSSIRWEIDGQLEANYAINPIKKIWIRAGRAASAVSAYNEWHYDGIYARNFTEAEISYNIGAEESQTASNTAPTIPSGYPDWSPTTAYTNDTLTCVGKCYDADGDTLYLSISVFKDGVNQTSLYNWSQVASNTNLTYIITPGNTSKGEKWEVKTICNDTHNWSSYSNSSNITISDYVPELRSDPSLTPTSPLPGNDLFCNFTIYDIDPGETIKAHVSWYVNGINSTGNYTVVTGVLNGTENYTVLGSGNTTDGEQWKCVVQPESSVLGTARNSTTVQITQPAILEFKEIEPLLNTSKIYETINVTHTTFYGEKYSGNPVMTYTETWEDSLVWPAVLYIDGVYHMWYGCVDDPNCGAHATRTCYANSTDGITWTKPNLGLSQYGGNSNNNIMFDWGKMSSISYNASADNASRKYIGVSNYRDIEGEAGIFYSSDGLHWQNGSHNRIITGTSGPHESYMLQKNRTDGALTTWDKDWILWAKYTGGDTLRRIKMYYNDTDVDGTWTEYGAISSINDGVSVTDERHHMSTSYYGGYYYGFVSQFRDDLSPARGNMSLWYSEDGYNWVYLGNVLNVSDTPSWDDGWVAFAHDPINQSGTNATNWTVWYSGENVTGDCNFQVGKATWRKEGFVGYKLADGKTEGYVTTYGINATATSNKKLWLNLNTTYGWMKVELLYPENMTVIPGYEKTSFDTISDSKTRKIATWGGSETLPNTNFMVRFYFHNSDAILYAYGFEESDTTPPAITITYPANSSTISSSWINITGTASDANPDTVYINDTNFGTNTGTYNNWNFTNTSLPDGTYSVKVTANDTSGNTNSAEVTFTIDTTPPTTTFVSQTPSDVSTTNILSTYLNITYDITDVAGVDETSVKLYYKTNTTTSDVVWFINGSSISGFQEATEYANDSNIWQFNLTHLIYSGSYNINDSVMESETKHHYSLDNDNKIIKIRFYNISNTKAHNYLVLDAKNQTDNTEFLRIYYCNESYTTGKPETSDYCLEFYNLQADVAENYTKDGSMYWIIPFAINTTTGGLNGVYVTNTSYFLLRPSTNIGGWNISYIDNVTRPDQVQYSSNNGLGYSDFSGTIDMHVHQFDGTDSLWYYVCANDTLDNSGCSSLRQDLLNLDSLPPTSPDVYKPTQGTYSGNITINYTESISPNAYPISNYTIDLVFADNLTFVTKIADNGLNLSYVWDSTGIGSDEYFIRVKACDNQSQCSYGYSENITIGASSVNITTVSVTPYEPVWVDKNITAYYNISIQNNGSAPLTGNVSVTSVIDHTVWTNITPETIPIIGLAPGGTNYSVVNVTGAPVLETTWNLETYSLSDYTKYRYTSNLNVTENWLSPNNTIYYNISRPRATGWPDRDSSLDIIKVDLTTAGVSSYATDSNITIIVDTTHGFSSLHYGNHPVLIIYYQRVPNINTEGGGGSSGPSTTYPPTVKEKMVKFILDPQYQTLTIVRDDGLLITLNQTVVDGSIIEIPPDTYSFCFDAEGYKETCFTDTIDDDVTKRVVLVSVESALHGTVSDITEQPEPTVPEEEFSGTKPQEQQNRGIIIILVAGVAGIILYLLIPKKEVIEHE